MRPSGIYGPGDRRLLKLFRGVARRRFVILGDGKIFYHLTHIDDLVEGFRLAGTVPAAAGRTYILAGGEVTTLNELVAIIAGEAGVRPLDVHLPVWPFWMAGRGVRGACARRSGSSRRSIGAGWTSSRRAARSTSAVRARNWALRRRSTCASGTRRTLAWYREQGWL